jgi:hypothetical protein
MGTKQYRMQVTLLGKSGIVLTRPVTLTDRFESNAKYRAGRIVAKPGQTVLNVEVVR